MARRLLPALAVLVVVGVVIGGSVVVRHRSTAASAAVELPTSTPTSTSTDGAGGPIAFVATRPHPRVTADVVPTPPVPTDIYTVRADGSGLRRITTDGAPKDLLAFSPDGSTLAYTVDPLGQVWTIAASGADRRLLCTRCVAISGGDQLAWSPRGHRLAARAPAGIVLIDPVTRRVAQIRISPGVVGLSWSPDGRSLALTVSGEGLAILDVGTGKHRIVDGARVAGPVAWSPDGRTIAFTTISYGPYQLHSGVVAYDAGTGRSRVLLAPRSTLGVYGLSWSPDSRAVAVLYLPIHPQRQGLLTVSRNGSEIRAIAVCGDAALGDGSCPSGNVVAWSPDGDHLLVEDFTYGGAGPSLLVLTPGGTTTRISGSLLPAWGLGWSPA
jgi:Tol biopolymer transport system component